MKIEEFFPSVQLTGRCIILFLVETLSQNCNSTTSSIFRKVKTKKKVEQLKSHFQNRFCFCYIIQIAGYFYCSYEIPSNELYFYVIFFSLFSLTTYFYRRAKKLTWFHHHSWEFVTWDLFCCVFVTESE